MSAMSDSENDLVDEFLKQRLKLCRLSSKGLLVGYLESRQAFDELVRDLKVLGCSYSVRSCYVGKDDRGTFQYSTTSSDVQIPFTGSPFRVEGTTYYLCTQGSKYYKSKLTSEDYMEDEDGGEVPRKRRRKVSRNIKVGCPAKMTVKCIRQYPDYKASVKSWRQKCDVLKRLKVDLKKTPPPLDQVQYWISVSPENAHTHKRATTQKIQALHPDLITEIHRLVKSGVTTVPAVKTRLLTFVEDMFKNSPLQPEPSNTAFYPNDKSIYNHLHDAKNGILKNQSNPPQVILKVENVKMEMCSGSIDTLSSIAVTPHQDTEIMKPDASLGDEPILRNSIESEWQDQTVFPPNFVQVVNNNGTIMLMVTQPIGEQISRVDSPLINSTANILNVNLDDNIFEVSVDPTDRILDLNDDTVMMSQSCDSQDGISHPLCIDDNTNLLTADKASGVDSNRIITLEGNVVVDVRHTNYEKADEKEVLSCSEEQMPLLFSGEEQLQLVEQEPDAVEAQISQQPLEHGNGPSAGESRTILYQQSESDILSLPESVRNNIQRNVELKSEREGMQLQILDTTSIPEKHEETLASIRHALKDCVEDITKMSFCCSNYSLLEKTFSALEKFRLRMHYDIEEKHNASSKDLSSLIASSQNYSTVLKNTDCVPCENVLCLTESDIRALKCNQAHGKKMNYVLKDDDNSLPSVRHNIAEYSLVISDM